MYVECRTLNHMNNRTPLPRPTDAELELLQVLWDTGPCTVRQIHESLPKQTGYTTTLKILQKMADKGLVERDESQKSHIYAAAIEAEKTQRQLLSHLIQSAFGGSPARLVMQALSDDRASEEDLARIRDMLQQLEQKKD